MTKREAGFWLAAAIDGEGHVRRVGNEVHITNTDLDFLAMAEKCLDILGVEYSIHAVSKKDDPTRKDVYYLAIGNVKNMAILYRWCPLTIGYKKEALERATVDKRFGQCPEGCECGKHTYYPRRDAGRGVTWMAAKKKFRAYTRDLVTRKQIHLGYFNDEGEALAVAARARAQMAAQT